MDIESFQSQMSRIDFRSGIYAEILTRFTIRETSGNKELSGAEQDDIFLIDSRKNNLEDVQGDDIYIFGLHSDDNTIMDTKGENMIMLSIMQDEFEATFVQNDVELRVGSNTITIKEFDEASSYSIIFLDGSMINLSELVFS